MITFVGLGFSEEDISLKGLKTVKNADKVYAEFYTSKLIDAKIDDLEKIFGKKIKILERSDLEENSRNLLEEAKRNNIVILVAGDPFVATTHSTLLIEAKKMGIDFKIIHNASIVSAIAGITGLHIYKFGKIATVSWPYKNVISKVPLDVIKQNLSINAHTLLLLEIDMKINQAVEILERIDDGTLNHFAVGVARVGKDNYVRCDYFYNLKYYDFGEPLHSIVFLSKKIHVTEYEFLKEFASPPKSLKNIVE